MHWTRVVWLWLAVGLAVAAVQFFVTDWAAGLDPRARCEELELTLPALARVEHAGQSRMPPATRCRVTECERPVENARELKCAAYSRQAVTVDLAPRGRDLVYLFGGSLLFSPLIALLVVALTRRRR